MPKTRESKIRANAKYDSTHCTGLYLKFNNGTDSDILEKLSSVPNRQGYIKSLIRQDIGTCSVPKQTDSVPVSAHKKMSLNTIYKFLQKQADMQQDKYDGVYDLLNALTGKLMGYTPGESYPYLQ